MKKMLTVLLLLALSGCSAPSWRVFERKVPEPVVVTPQQREAWATGASWLDINLVAGETVTAPADQVANSLSRSIGLPAKPVAKPEDVIKILEKQLAKERERNEALMEFIRNNQGRTIEGSGLDLLGWTDSYWFWLFVVIAIVLAGGGPILLFFIRNLFKTLGAAVKGVEHLRATHPEVVDEFEAFVGRKMDTAQKKVITNVKAGLIKSKQL